MSSFEYYDLFLKCQSSGKYQIITFDMVNSKLINPQKRNVLQAKMLILIETLYDQIQQIEQDKDTKILVFEDNFQRLKDNYQQVGFGLKTEPFILGDMVGFTIYRDSIDLDYIIKLFNQLKYELKIDIDFHINTGYYETNDYELGHDLLFRGYCIDIVSNLHKNTSKKLLKTKNSQKLMIY